MATQMVTQMMIQMDNPEDNIQMACKEIRMERVKIIKNIYFFHEMC
jgi:hypothetical protein